jgi:hypothetical protein
VSPVFGLVVEYQLIERPIGDAFIDQELWQHVEPVGSPETRSLLTENGIRIGVLGRIMPPQLQAILSTKADQVGPPQLMTFNNRKETVIPTAGPLAEAHFNVLTDLAGRPMTCAFREVKCGVLVRPAEGNDGRVRLWCEPQLQHGNRQQHYRPSEDGTQLTAFEEVPTERFPRLGFEVPLRPNECLVIGCNAELAEAIGHTLFSAEAAGNPRQRLLVVRSSNISSNPMSDLPPIPQPGRLSSRARSTRDQ